MSSRKGGVQFTPDFSTLPGASLRTKFGCRSEIQTTGYSYVARGTFDAVVGGRSKSVTVAGSVDPLTGVRLATNYTRIIHTCVNFNDEFTWYRRDGWPAGAENRYYQNCPIGQFGLFLNNGGYYNRGANLVSINPDYASRAETEALLLLREQRVAYGVAAAELGEVLRWVASLVGRLVDVLLIISDVIKGRIRRAVAHRKIYGNRTVYSTTGVAGSRFRPQAFKTGKSPQHWSDRAYSRWLIREGKRIRRTMSKGTNRKRVANAWLEYQYAVLPLVFDIYGTLENLERGVGEKPLLFSVQRTIGGPVDPNALASCNHSAYSCSGRVRQSARVVFTGQGGTSTLATLEDLGVLNPWSVAWELVPFSFVIDWLIPIGKILSSYTAPLGVRFVDGYMDRVVSGSYTASVVPASYKGQVPSAKCKITAFQRVRYTGWPLPDFYKVSPWSYPHVINAAALITQLSLRK